MDMNAVENREKERERRVRGGRGTRFTDADGGAGGGNANQNDATRDRSRDRRNCRVYISNIPYDYRWQELKDDFRRIVGSVEYVQLFHDESGKPRGCGVVEFKDPDSVQKALDEMNRYEVNGRKLVVKEDNGDQRDQYGRIVREGGGGGGGVGGGGGAGVGVGSGGGRDHMDNRDRGFSRRDEDNISGRNNFNMMSNVFNNSSNYNLYGLSASFLESLGINGPLHNKVFVANLDYKVDNKKLKQVFKLAGKVQSVDLSLDKEGNSRGFAVVEYDHPVEAVQAISMLDRQMLYDRRMTVRLDRIPDKSEGLKLPEGLGGVGIGLGPNGDPLKDVARNLPNMMNQSQPMSSVGVGGGVLAQQSQQLSTQGGGNGSIMGNLGGVMFGNSSAGQTAPIASNTKSLGTSAASLNLNNLSTNNLAAVVGALSNPLISSSLNSFGLSLGNSGSGIGGNTGNDDAPSSGNAGLSNNYSTGSGGGNNYSSGFGGSAGYSSGGGVSSGYNAYSSGSSNTVGNNANNKLDGNDYTTGGGNNLDLYGGGNNPGSGNNSGRKSDTIIIKNLPPSCTWQTLRDKFRDVGEIKFAEMRGNDLGLVRFFKERDAECAVALMDGSRLDGRTINVAYF